MPDTLIINKDGCVGMTTNMIAVRKRIIVYNNEGTYVTMFNSRSSKNQGRMIPMRGVFLYLAALANEIAIRPSKYNGKPPSFKSESKGRHRLFSAKSLIAMESNMIAKRKRRK